MNDTSPSSSIEDNSSESSAPSLSLFLWFLLGIAIGAAPPLLLGGYLIAQFSAYTATLPPDAAVCGTPLLLPVALFIFVTPITALLGGGIALLLVVIIRRTG